MMAEGIRAPNLPIGIALAVFVTVGVLRWPLIPIVAVSIPVSVLAAFWFKEAKHG